LAGPEAKIAVLFLLSGAIFSLNLRHTFHPSFKRKIYAAQFQVAGFA
jgi:hypothetical protein